MDSKQSQAIIEEICEYSETHQVKELLQEYMKRLVLNKPQDPVSFLIKSIEDKPFQAQSPRK